MQGAPEEKWTKLHEADNHIVVNHSKSSYRQVITNKKWHLTVQTKIPKITSLKHKHLILS